jgi:hypothetical protein
VTRHGVDMRSRPTRFALVSGVTVGVTGVTAPVVTVTPPPIRGRERDPGGRWDHGLPSITIMMWRRGEARDGDDRVMA